MAGTILEMSKVKQIIRLRENGVALQRIARSLDISRNTVKKYLRLIEVKGYENQKLLSMEDMALEQMLSGPSQVSEKRYQVLEELFPYFAEELKRNGVTRWILWGEYKEKYPDGYSYAHFCYYLREWMRSREATMHFEHTAGDKMFIDFAGKKLQWVEHQTGIVHDVEVYVAILGYSQLTYVEAVTSQKKVDFIRATENALHYFKGVPQVLVPDNLKGAVHKANKYEAELNTDFRNFANHYHTTVLPARSFKPRDKALVENAVKVVYSRIYAPLRDRIFFSLRELNTAIAELLEAHNNKAFQKTAESRRERYLQVEKDKLMPLATDRYEMKSYKFATVMKNSHVHLSEDKHYYSIPYRFIGKKVKLVYSRNSLSVYYNKERIAFHKRDPKRFGYTTLREHLPSTHQFVSDWNPDKFLRWAAGIDPKVKQYIMMILERRSYPEQAYRSCVGILSQEKKVGRQRLISAIERAMQYGIYNYKIIDRILKGGLDRLKEDDEKQTSLPFHENIRGSQHYQ